MSSPAIRTVPRIVQGRENQRIQARRNPALLAGLGCSLLVSLIGVAGAILLVLAYSSLTQGLPSPDALPGLLNPPDGLLLQPTRLYDRSGEHLLLTLQNPAAAGRQYLYLENPGGGSASDRQFFPTSLITATIATAEPAFWKSQGLSTMVSGLFNRPTIAQRLVSNLLFWDEPQGLKRNLRERLLAAQVIDRFGHEKVIEWYLNNADYGNLAFGADAAARLYFGKPATQLSLAEAALLAGVAENPAFNPLDASQAALDRQKQVLQSMLEQGLISAEQAGQASQAVVSFNTATLPVSNPAPAFTNLALEQLSSQFNRQRLERGGFRVITTLDYDLQLQSACAASTQLARSGFPQASLPAADGSECQAARLLPTLTSPDNPAISDLAANLLILDPKTGQILALVGEPNPGLDPARLTGHTPGSLLTPFIYLTSFTRGLSPATLVWDIPNTLPNLDIQNFDGQSHGPMRLRLALANDYLVPAVQMLAQLGPENVWRTAQQLGLVSLTAPADAASYRLPMEGGEVTLLEASQAYGVFSNQGIMAGHAFGSTESPGETTSIQPVTIQRVEDILGQKIWADWSQPETRPVINQQLAYLTTNVLSDEAARWPSLGHPNALEIGRPAAAKIGRTLPGNDTWTVGYTPQMVVGVWIGRSDAIGSAQPGSSSEQIERVPPNLAAGLWHAVMQYAHRNLPPQIWAVPPGISQVEVCDPSGMLPTPNCPSIVTETFIAGNEPTQADSLYQTFQVNRETGRLVTIFTPPDLIEDRNYLVVPPDALGWARRAGIDLPPTSYDVIMSPLAVSQDVNITSPAMFGPVRGEVPILGSAQGADFGFYRVQVGKGLNPQQWLQVGEEVTKPVSNGQLAIWDTSGLDGLYVIQLLVVDKEQRVESTFVQVTVDNQAPEVSIIYPVQDQQIDIPDSGKVTLQASATDNLSIAKVEYFLDNQLVASLSQPPFAIPWQAKPGPHTLRVKAFDTAGNTREASVTFTLK
jgi:membrane peptidoglycan carboxypeptidase